MLVGLREEMNTDDARSHERCLGIVVVPDLIKEKANEEI